MRERGALGGPDRDKLSADVLNASSLVVSAAACAIRHVPALTGYAECVLHGAGWPPTWTPPPSPRWSR